MDIVCAAENPDLQLTLEDVTLDGHNLMIKPRYSKVKGVVTSVEILLCLQHEPQKCVQSLNTTHLHEAVITLPSHTTTYVLFVTAYFKHIQVGNTTLIFNVTSLSSQGRPDV